MTASEIAAWVLEIKDCPADVMFNSQIKALAQAVLDAEEVMKNHSKYGCYEFQALRDNWISKYGTNKEPL